MRVILLFVSVLLGFVTIAEASPVSSKLLGRWRADTVPTGYWIIDRHSDGRFAKKQFIMLDYAKPTEVVISWGHWKLKGQTYSEIVEGTTSPSLRRFSGKWKDRPVSDISAARFAFSSSDGHNRTEQREADRRPLSAVVMSAPNQTEQRTLIDTTKNAALVIPKWVEESRPPVP